jgi:hypothetical protein
LQKWAIPPHFPPPLTPQPSLIMVCRVAPMAPFVHNARMPVCRPGRRCWGAAKTFRFRLPSDVTRILGFKIVNSAAGDARAVSAALDAVFSLDAVFLPRHTECACYANSSVASEPGRRSSQTQVSLRASQLAMPIELMRMPPRINRIELNCRAAQVGSFRPAGRADTGSGPCRKLLR